MPTVDPPSPPGMSSVLARNIAALNHRRARDAAGASRATRAADAITRFTGSMPFVFIHLVVFGGWILINLGAVPGIAPFDPTFVILAMEASVEAIFLSTFVLISQNRQAALAEERAELDLQIGLLAEHEVTRLTALVRAIADKLEVRSEVDDELPEIERDVAPEQVLDAIGAARA